MADPRGRAPGTPLRTKIFLITCSVWENLANLLVGAPLLEGWRPLLRGIVDPPLQNIYIQESHEGRCTDFMLFATLPYPS